MGTEVDPHEFMVKICGISNLGDARHAIEYGANALGFNFYPASPRYLEPARAEEISSQISEHVLTVGVMVIGPDEDLTTLERLSQQLPSFGAFQLHGLKTESRLTVFQKPVYVATSQTGAGAFPNSAIIIDSSWGRGEKADWEQLKRLKRRFILSGGLTPDNVASAIESLSPAGVDVCSGVENSPGVKDREKIERFLKNVHQSLGDARLMRRKEGRV